MLDGRVPWVVGLSRFAIWFADRRMLSEIQGEKVLCAIGVMWIGKSESV